MAKITIERASFEDLDGIMVVEEARFGSVSLEAMASRETMRDRMVMCNGFALPWFLVAKSEGRIGGYIILQPTDLGPDECTSWATSTDNGTMKKTFNNEGMNLYAVSVAALKDAPHGTAEYLIFTSFVYWLAAGKKQFIWCSRMPGFRDAYEKERVTADEYWRATRPGGGPVDWLLYEYWDMVGVMPLRFLENGFPPDVESGGHGVLFAASDPILALSCMSRRIYAAGVASEKKRRSV